MRIHQEDFNAEVESRKKERLEHETEKKRLLALVNTLEAKVKTLHFLH